MGIYHYFITQKMDVATKDYRFKKWYVDYYLINNLGCMPLGHIQHSKQLFPSAQHSFYMTVH